MRRILLLSMLLLGLPLAVSSVAANDRSASHNVSQTSNRPGPRHRIKWEGASPGMATLNQRLNQLNQMLDLPKWQVADQQRQKYLRENYRQRQKYLRESYQQRRKYLRESAKRRQKYLRESARERRYPVSQQTPQRAQPKYKAEAAKQDRHRETAELKLELVDPPQDSLFEADATADGLQPLRTYIQPAEQPPQILPAPDPPKH